MTGRDHRWPAFRRCCRLVALPRVKRSRDSRKTTLLSEHGAELLLGHGDGVARPRARRHDAVHRQRVAAGAGRGGLGAGAAAGAAGPSSAAAARAPAAAATAEVARQVHAHREDHEGHGRRHDEDVRRLARIGRRSAGHCLHLGSLRQERKDLHACVDMQQHHAIDWSTSSSEGPVFPQQINLPLI